METREEKLATWADPSDARLRSLKVLKGSIPLNSNTLEKPVHISEETIQCDQIKNYLLDTNEDEISDRKGSPNLWHFKAISFPQLRQGRLVLSFPKEVFQQIQESWNLHPRTIEVFLSNNGVFTTFQSPNKKQSFFLIKVAISRSSGLDCVSVTCDTVRRTTYALYHHLEDEASVFANLLSTPERCVDPYFSVAALYRSHYQCIEIHRHSIDNAIKSVERQTGFGTPGRLVGWFLSKGRSSLDESSVLTDPGSTIQQLSYCQTDLAIIGHVGRCCSDCGEWLVRDIEESLIDEPPQHDEHELKQNQENQKVMRQMIRQDVEYIRRRAVMLLSQVQALRERVQSQTNFMLNIIAQRDAEYTAAIAVDGKRDSIAMKMIAVLGIVFLPGTYIATLLGTNMFTWSDPDGEELSSLKASHGMWIYWVITVPLTILTFIVWLLLSRRANHESSKRLSTYRKKNPFQGAGTAATNLAGPVSSEKMV